MSGAISSPGGGSQDGSLQISSSGPTKPSVASRHSPLYAKQVLSLRQPSSSSTMNSHSATCAVVDDADDQEERRLEQRVREQQGDRGERRVARAEARDILEKYDPAMKEAYLKFTEEKSAASAKGSSPYDIMKAAAGATNVGIKMSTEYQSKLDNLAKFEGIANDPTKSPAERQSARDMAQSIRRDITQKDGPPKGWVDEISGMAQGVKAAEEIKALVKQHGVTPLNPAARAEIAQQYSYVLNAMKKSENFGAALTGNEQKILENGVRNPNDFFNNILLGSQTHIRLLDKYIAYTKDRAQMQQNMYRTGDLPPELSRGPSVPAPPPGFRHMNR